MPQIKKCNYKRYDQQPGKPKRLTQTGYCYYFFWNRWTPKGYRIPFTLKITKYHTGGTNE